MSEHDCTEIQLEPNTHEMVVQYNRDDETFAETLERIITTFIPTRPSLEKQTRYDATDINDDSRFVIERWPDTDNYHSLYVYQSKSDYLQAHADMVPHVLHGDENTSTEGSR